jgi:PKD repeat protein
VANGTYNLTYTVTDSEGCIAKDLVTITNDRPDANFTSDAKPTCGTVTVDFTNQSAGAVSYEWDFDDPLDPGTVTDVDPTHDFSNFTSQVYYFNVQLVAFSANGCTDTSRQVVTVYPSIDATFTLDTTQGCNPLTVTMNALPGGSSYFWDYGDGNAENTGAQTVHQFNNTGTDPVTYTVSLTTTSFYGCVDNKTQDVTVYPLPAVNFTADPIIQVYPNATVNFNNLTPIGSWTFDWDFGDGNTSTVHSPSHTYADPGIYNVTLTTSTVLCADSASHQITIQPAVPVAAFTQPASGCAPLEIAFENLSQYATSYVWDFGNGSSSFKQNPTFTYYESGIYSVSLTVFGPGGTDNITQLVEVSLTPNPYTTVAPQFVFVNDVPVKCFNLTTDTAQVSYLWEFGDGDTSSIFEPTHIYQEPGRFDITLTATNGNNCSNSFTFSYVEVEPAGELIFPTVFRPNADGPSGGEYVPGQDNNQIFFPGVYDQVIEYEMTVYNRWGELIFISEDVSIGWDGWIEGKKMAEQGVYIWKVKGKYANGKNFVHVGDITLLK